MKPQDLVILLKIISLKNQEWRVVDLALSLFLSQSEVSKALERLFNSGLIDESKRVPARSALYDLIVNAVKYIFPVKPGRISRGIPTSHSANPLSLKFVSESNYVWPYLEGKMKGESIEPLYKNLPKAVLNDQKLHELLALVDAIRVGKVREQDLARKELKKRFRI